MSGALRAEDRITAGLTGLAAVGSAGVGGFVGGLPGALAGGVLVAAWLAAPPIFVVALGQVLFAAVLPADASLVTVALVEVPFVAILLVDVFDRRAPLHTLALGVASLLAFGGLAGVGIHWSVSLWQAGLVLVSVAAVGSYGLHRYTVVTFEITDEF